MFLWQKHRFVDRLATFKKLVEFHVHSNIIHSSEGVEASQVSTNRHTNKM